MVTCILLKEPKHQDPFVTALQGAGFEPKDIHCRAVLGHELCALDVLCETFRNGRHSGVIVTSQRAVEAWSVVLGQADDQTETQTRWRDVPHYVVGAATASSLSAIPSAHAPLPEQLLGQSSGHADALADFIAAQHADTTAPVLYLTGDKRRDVIPQALDGVNIPFQEICVYKTAVDPAFASSFSTLLDQVDQQARKQPDPIWLAFFSPSGANAAIPILSQRPDLRHRIRFAALGPTTARHLREHHNTEPHAVAAGPKPELLAQAIGDAAV